MTPESFARWLAACEAAGLVRPGHGRGEDVARLLGKTPRMVRNYIASGTTERQTDLACAAILAGLEPWGE